MVDLTSISTEQRNPNTMNLDSMDPLHVVQAMNREDRHVAEAVGEVLPAVAEAVEAARTALLNGGRIVYLGAGTSGRLGVLDAAECPPTFGVSPGVVVGLIAGGEQAFVHAVEGAEDDPALGARDLDAINVTDRDLVVGLAASGRTPYVLGVLGRAKELGCTTVAIDCSPGAPIAAVADIAIEPEPGPEVLTGSTRLKAGTAQKMVLNMISTGAMVGVGKAYENLMVDVQQTNEKLNSRALRIVCEACSCDADQALEALEAAGHEVKTAVVMVLTGVDAQTARRRLDKAAGHVRGAISQAS